MVPQPPRNEGSAATAVDARTAAAIATRSAAPNENRFIDPPQRRGPQPWLRAGGSLLFPLGNPTIRQSYTTAYLSNPQTRECVRSESVEYYGSEPMSGDLRRKISGYQQSLRSTAVLTVLLVSLLNLVGTQQADAFGRGCAHTCAQRDDSLRQATRSRNCGHFRLRGERVDVAIERGHVTCKRALSVFRTFLTRRARTVDGNSATHRLMRVGRWKCDTGPGQASCFRHGKRYSDARDYILAFFTAGRPGLLLGPRPNLTRDRQEMQ